MYRQMHQICKLWPRFSIYGSGVHQYQKMLHPCKFGEQDQQLLTYGHQRAHVLKPLSFSKHLNILQHVKFMAQIQFKYLRSIYRSICIIHASLAEIGQVITKIQDLQQKIYVQMPTPRVQHNLPPDFVSVSLKRLRVLFYMINASLIVSHDKKDPGFN